jgi:hypothetical protein
LVAGRERSAREQGRHQRKGATVRKRLKELRRAGRTFWRFVVRRSPRTTLSRRVGASLAWHHVVCGLMTGGDHAWGPLRYEYEGARRRKQSCRWCGAKRIPAEEIARTQPTEAEWQEMQRFLPTSPPSKADVALAVEAAKEAGLLRNGKWLWD